MKLYTYLNYGGNCREAFEFYVQHLGGRIISMMAHGDVPNAKVPPDWRKAGSVEHALRPTVRVPRRSYQMDWGDKTRRRRSVRASSAPR